MPSISLLIPCFRSESYISKVLDCAVSQTEPYHEIICYDDGGGDGSLEIARRYGARTMLSPTNGGPSYSRHQMLAQATGEYVHFHDSDDLIDKHFVAHMGPSLRPTAVTLCSQRVQPVSGETYVSTIPKQAFDNPVEMSIKRFIHFNQAVFPADTIRRLPMVFTFDIKIYDDKLSFLSVALKGLEFDYVNEPLTTWVQRKGSVMHSHSWVDGTRALKRYCEYALALDGIPKDLLASYVFEKCWMNYYQDPATIGPIREILALFKTEGIRELNCLGTKERLLSKVLPIDMVLKILRQWAVFRGNALPAAR